MACISLLNHCQNDLLKSLSHYILKFVLTASFLCLLLLGCKKASPLTEISSTPIAQVYDNAFTVVSQVEVTPAQLASMNQKNTNYAYWYEIMKDKTEGVNSDAEMKKLKAQGYKINLTIGNSLFNNWSGIQTEFSKYKVINRAFGGAAAEHMMYYLEDLGVQYADNLFLYFGENEFLPNFRKDLVDDNIIRAIDYWKEKYPKLKVVCVLMQVCPSLWVDSGFRLNFAEAGNKQIEGLLNSKLREFAATHRSSVKIADMNRAMKNRGNPPTPKTECFVTQTINGKTQQVHMNAAGYKIWRDVLTPFMIR